MTRRSIEQDERRAISCHHLSCLSADADLDVRRSVHTYIHTYIHTCSRARAVCVRKSVVYSSVVDVEEEEENLHHDDKQDTQDDGDEDFLSFLLRYACVESPTPQRPLPSHGCSRPTLSSAASVRP